MSTDTSVNATQAANRTTDHSLIKSITPRGSDPVEVGALTVFVGPNNVGKTAILRDILRLGANFDVSALDRSGDDEPQPIVLSDLSFVPKLSVERMTLGLTVVDESHPDGPLVHGVAPNLRMPLRRSISKNLKNILYRPIMTARSVWTSSLGQLMALRMAYFSPDDRQHVVEPTALRSPVEGPENLLQSLYYAEPEIHEALNDAFGEVFDGMHIKLDASGRVSAMLRIADEPFPAETGDAIANVRQYESMRMLHKEGDAYQSVVGMVMTILLGQGRVILLDHPEMFLHPEQARRLGRWIGTRAPEYACQVFVTTSSDSFLDGLSEGRTVPTILRTSRREDITHLHTVPPAPTKAIARFPVFSTQNSLGALFCDGAVVAPGDRDRVIYQTVAGRFSDARNFRFLQASGAKNLPFVAGAFRQAGVPVCVITELDIFRTEKDFTELVKAVTGDPPPQPWLATRDRLENHVDGAYDDQALSRSAHEVESFLSKLEKTDIPAKPELSAAVAVNSARNWEKLRHERLEWLPRETRIWVEELIEDLKRKGIFVSPRGHLKAWLDLDVKDPTVWLNNALQSLHVGKCPAELQAFVGDVVSHLRASAAPARPTRFGNRT
ncbi:MAG: hypothetical protein CMJ64_17140 [Planctomycetaceae bacterium]|nr:hypothetical protein [Planctomycetaceae bacterium]